jgi:tRNA 2-thiocytidine biosynthesis protein TtcA
MLKDWEKQFPGRLENMFSALQNVVPSHLMDTKLHPFTTLQATGLPCEDGDKAFDDEPVAAPAVDPARADEPDETHAEAGNAGKPRAVIPISAAH